MNTTQGIRGTPPLVSIGMSVHNCQHTLAAALSSILLQTYENWELILIDDGSVDDTMRVAKRFPDPRIRLYQSDTNMGLPVQLNKAITLSSGDYFARMDGDDVCYPQRLERQVAFMTSNPEVDLSGTGVMVFGNDGKPFGKRVGPSAHWQICAHPWAPFPLAHPTFMGDMDWFKRYGYRDIVRAEDQDLLLRSYQHSRFANLPEILLGYREDSVNLKNSLKSRRSSAAVAFRFFSAQGDWPNAIRGASERAVRSAADIFSAATGWGRGVLGHRTHTLSSAERAAWQETWQEVQQQIAEMVGDERPV